MTEIGHETVAQELAEYHHNASTHLPSACEQLGRGEHRTVYIDWDTATVYKIGHDGANRREHDTLSGLDRDWAPATTLYEVEVEAPWGEPLACTVIAMPYLPNDSDEADEDTDVVEILLASGDLNTDNIHINGGRMWLIDAGGVW